MDNANRAGLRDVLHTWDSRQGFSLGKGVWKWEPHKDHESSWHCWGKSGPCRAVLCGESICSEVGFTLKLRASKEE